MSDTNCRCRSNRQAGFTLVELLVAMTVLGLMLGFVVSRGPVHSQHFEMQTAVDMMVQSLRLARSKAIASNGPVQFLLDSRLGNFRIDQGIQTMLPRSLVIATALVPDEGPAQNLKAIRFEGDGSASGGRIDLVDGQWRAQIGVDWMTGRISVTRPH